MVVSMEIITLLQRRDGKEMMGSVTSTFSHCVINNLMVSFCIFFFVCAKFMLFTFSCYTCKTYKWIYRVINYVVSFLKQALLEESKQAHKTTGQASHRISRGLHNRVKLLTDLLGT